MRFPRLSGILLHPTSLPNRFGIGDLGDEAYRFIDFLAASEQSLWQVLPLGPTGYGDSPYQCFSAFAGNPLLVSPEQLVAEGLLDKQDLRGVPKFPVEKIDFGWVIPYKMGLLERAYSNFKKSTDTDLRAAFLAFRQEAAPWLDDYALFRALKDQHKGVAWNKWKPQYALRDAKAINEAREKLHDKIEAHRFFQFLFFKEWRALKNYCHDKGIKIIGDVPIFIAYDSADVWTNPELFKLDAKGRPLVVAGVPPDYFSKTGQLWGNPIYNWEKMQATKFQWWIERLQATFNTVDIVRIDHFRGFCATWEVPARDKTAKNGRWVEVPGKALFTRLNEMLGELPIIAEDLGVITPDVEALRDGFGFPGMRIFQFAFRDRANIDLPHNYIPHSVAYTGTHDNDTAVGWFNSKAGEGSTRSAEQIAAEKRFCMDYLNTRGKAIHWDFIRAVLASVADTAIIPMQDILGLGSEARMNLPASQQGNWQWRYKANALNEHLSNRLNHLTELYVRNRA
ncbi:MAG: 4-alpha-glucanotransferase [Acidobacteriota bacterium]